MWHRPQQWKEENPVGETQAQTIRTLAAIATSEQQEQDRTILLLTTFVQVRGDAPHTKTIKVPVLFDVGSERSFILEETVQQLDIEVGHTRSWTHTEPLIIDGFGGAHNTHCTSARVRLKMKSTDGRLFTTFANSVPRLAEETEEEEESRTKPKTTRTIRTCAINRAGDTIRYLCTDKPGELTVSCVRKTWLRLVPEDTI
uniref:Peptidase aspartic putative domain-containing protein n=1 Tax=Parascaris univalens TaxID=6257 RepID=A0A915A3Y7_PARUN